jgi:hypothetical protein
MARVKTRLLLLAVLLGTATPLAADIVCDTACAIYRDPVETCSICCRVCIDNQTGDVVYDNCDEICVPNQD